MNMIRVGIRVDFAWYSGNDAVLLSHARKS
jgi:hypothetical protein